MWESTRWITGLVLLVSFAIGCEGVPTSGLDTAPAVDGPRFMGKPDKPGGGGGQDIIPLRVTIGAGFGVSDDGAGDYVHKEAEVLARIFATGNFGLDVRGSVKGKGKNKTGIDRRVCLTLTERGDPSKVLFQGCEDTNLTTSRPDANHPNGFPDLTDPSDLMTTRMRFLWGNETTGNTWLDAAGVGIGDDVWVRYGSGCFDVALNDWPDVPTERAIAVVDGSGWVLDGGDAFWCGKAPDSNVPVGPDPEGKVSATVEFHLEPL